MTDSRCWNWHRYSVRVLHSGWARELVERSGLRAGERALDVACGTGAVARWIAPIVGAAGRTVALDLDPEMIEVAKALEPPSAGTIEWLIAPAYPLAFADASFDVAFVQQGLQFFPDRGAAVAELRRVLVPDGRAAVTVYRAVEHNPSAAVMADVLGRRFGDTARATLLHGHALGDAGELDRLFRAAGFAHVDLQVSERIARWASVDEFVTSQLTGCTKVAQVLPADATQQLAAIAREVRERLARFVEPGAFAVPMQSHVVLARGA